MNLRMIGVIAIAAIFVGVIVYYFFRATPLKNVPPTASGPILFFGDSLVEGVGATAGHDLSALLAKSLGEPVLNYGVSGDTTQQGLARLSAARNEKPRLVLILLGGNDFLQKVPREKTFSNLEKMITAFQSDGAAVILIGVRSGLLGGGADKEYKSLAAKTGSYYVEDVLEGVFANESLMSDAIHPNDRGYEKIAERLIPIVQELLVGE